MQAQKEPELENNDEWNILLGLHYLAREANGASLGRLATLIKDSIRSYLFENAKGSEDETRH